MSWLKPDRIYESIDLIDFSSLAESGKKLILLDIDNTLVRHGSRQADSFTQQIIARIRQAGLIPYIVSNAKNTRARLFAESAQVEFCGLSGKPSPRGLLRGMNHYQCTADQTVMIGDQLFTDIIAAHRAKVLKILVMPLDRHEAWNVAIKRLLEAPFLANYKKQPDLWPQK
ncbi:MAG: YqeG family HAD IIIA-type phosphatase [Eubacteriales bacterium]|nr:YqeG family HAD IIIA-type phosphatase [Eubacteriales bacterium]